MSNTQQQAATDEFKPIATKISQQAAAMLDGICKKNNITIYELLQTIVDCAIRYMSDEHKLSFQLQRVMEIFFSDLRGSTFRLSDYTNDPGIIEAIMILGDRKHAGNRAVLVKEPFFGTAEENWNEPQQLEEYICKIMPLLYRRLRIVGAEMGTKTTYETIYNLVTQALQHDTIEEETRAMFSDNERDDRGREMTDAPYVRHNNRDPHAQ